LVCAWEKPGTPPTYTEGTTTNLTVNSPTSVKWSTKDVVKTGIAYTRSTNTGFFQIDGIIITPITHSITYNRNGGTGTVPTQVDKKTGETFTAAAPTGLTAPSGKKFKEWNTKDDGTGTAYAIGATVTMPAADLILYAIWEDINTYTVTVNSGTGSGSYKAGDIVNITANAAPAGQEFDKWTVTGVVLFTPGNASTSFTMPANAVTVTATYKPLSPATYSITVQNDGKGTANASSASAMAGTEITLTATPNSGYKFKEWQVVSGGITISSNKFTMPANAVTVKAVFEAIPTYTVTVTNGTGGGNYAENAVVTIIANTPSADKMFDKWTTTDGVTFTNENSATTTFTMLSKAVTVTATYKDLPAGSFSVTVNGGTTDKSAAAEGETISITAGAAPEGKTFDKWTTIDGVTFADASKATTTFTMPAKNVTVTATYKDLPTGSYSITVQNGTANKSSAASGETITITANVPVAGKMFDRWTSDDGMTFKDETAQSTTFTMPAKNVIVTAVYKDLIPGTFSITVQNDGNGMANASVNSAAADTEITLTTIPNSGYQFKEWQSIDGGVTIADNKFIMPANNVTIKAVFEKMIEIPNVLSIKLPQKNLYIKKGKKVKMPAVAYTQKGEKVTLKWKSKKTSVVKVTQKGVVKGVKKGKATITVTAYGKMAQLKVFVVKKAIKVKKVVISKKIKKAMKVGKSKFLTAAVKPKKATGKTGAVYKWKSGNKKIVKVDAVGKITAVKKGKCKITVTVGGKKKSFAIEVKK